MLLSVSADWACGHALRVPARPVHSRAAKLGGLFQRATIITGLPGSQSCPYEPSRVRSPPAVRDHQRPALGPTFTRSARARKRQIRIGSATELTPASDIGCAGFC